MKLQNESKCPTSPATAVPATACLQLAGRRYGYNERSSCGSSEHQAQDNATDGICSSLAGERSGEPAYKGH